MQENHPSDQAQQIRQPEEVSAGRPETMVTPDAQMTERQAKARLRHRVIGGLVLVATAVVFLPLVFETPAIDTQEEAQTRIPAIPKEPLDKLELVVNRPEPVSMGKGPLKDLTQPNEVGEEAPAPMAADTQVASTGTLFIQVLATSSERGAMREMAKYQAMGLPVYAVKVQKKSATLWRVRLGLFKTKAEAEKVVQYLNSQNISHMPIQVEKTQSNAIERLKPEETLKTATKKATEAAEQAKASKPQASAQKSVTKSSAPTQKASSSQSAANKPKTQAAKPAAKSQTQAPKAATKPVAKPQASKSKKIDDDPLAGMIRNAERDFIAEQLAKERAQKH